MASTELERFVQAIVDDHGLATGIKTLSTHYDLIAYANIRGYGVTLSEWGRYVAMDMLQASDQEITLMLQADPAHWSWAFRQVSRWRTLLMEGAGQEGLLGPADLAMPAQTQSSTSQAVPSAELTDDQKDAALRDFIELVRSRPEPGQVKAARNRRVISRAVRSDSD